MQHRLNNIQMLDVHVTVTICVKKLDRKLRTEDIKFYSRGYEATIGLCALFPTTPLAERKGRETEEG